MNTQRRRGWAAVLVAAILVTLAATTVAPAQQDFKTLVYFDGGNGALPHARLVQGLDGNLYGTTSGGGDNYEICLLGCGTVFKMTPAGKLTTQYLFCGKTDCTDGNSPYGGLVQGTDGNFYGTTVGGGAGDACSSGPCGTIFKITAGGTLTTLHSFDSSDGANPYDYDGLVLATNGNFYGTAVNGGAHRRGAVFEVNPTGTLTTLYSFCALTNCADGTAPFAGLVQATGGNFYGTTEFGGVINDDCVNGCGTVFKITPAGTLTTLYSFCSQTNCPDGAHPNASLVQADDGNFYGTTPYGGANRNPELCRAGCGTVFRLTPEGSLTTIYSFCAQTNCMDGFLPAASLIQATDGNFYGTTQYGGDTGCIGGADCGTVFKITPTGSLTTLHSFDGSDGDEPLGSLVQATSGTFYGTTFYLGTSGSCPMSILGGCGTVFSLSVGLKPFVKTLPTSANVGATVKILGTDLTGATSVTFDQTSATFQVVSPSEITTTVPTGATTGQVKVVTPDGTLTSNLVFRVR
jgi:uncharacterized repeat protein (TIGR03803 family)